MEKLVLLLYIMSVETVRCLYIDGCPQYGCRPSGSFSFSQTIPKDGLTVNWVNTFLLDPVPLAAGCVADSMNIVCLSNGPFSDNKGYISIYSKNGTIRWRDRYLTYPTMPILDNYGDVTGTDGTSLIHYDQDGKKYPIISVAGIAPVFHIQLVGNIYLLMVSENGGLFVRDTKAIPVADIFLNETVQGIKGIFVPISQPVVNDQRFYLLTEFIPNTKTLNKQALNLQRLYAIDIHHRMNDIITIAWFFDFEKVKSQEIHNIPRFTEKSFLKNIKNDIRSKQNLLWDESRGTVYVTLPPLYKYGAKTTQQANTFWALKDHGNSTSLNFRSDLDVTHMATFESNDFADIASPQQFWATTSSSKILSITEQGKVTTELDLNALLNAQVNITSKMSLVRDEKSSSDILVFAVKTMSSLGNSEDNSLRFVPEIRIASNYIVAIDTGSDNGALLWKVPVPDGLEVKGQISGSKGEDAGQKDQLVFYADDGAKTAHIFTLK